MPDPDPPDPHAEEHRRAAEAASIYRSHVLPPPPQTHRISFEDERLDPPPHPRVAPREDQPGKPRAVPAPRVLIHRIDAPFGTAFLGALGWSAGRALFRLIMLMVMLAIFALVMWRLLAGL